MAITIVFVTPRLVIVLLLHIFPKFALGEEFLYYNQYNQVTNLINIIRRYL